MASYSLETKAAALADIAAGSSIRHVSTKYGVPPMTLQGWKKKAGIRTATVREKRTTSTGTEPERTEKEGARGVMSADPGPAEAGGDAGTGVTNGSGEAPAGVMVVSPPPAAPPLDLDALLTNLLRENLLTLAAQQEFFRNEDWLRKQSAADLAILHGVSTDKALRLLEAYRPGDGADDGGGGRQPSDLP
jgi:hypothetical protein